MTPRICYSTFDTAFSGTITETGQRSYISMLSKPVLLLYTGDGALWIANQINERFDAQGCYLINIYHPCDQSCCSRIKCCMPPPEWINKYSGRTEVFSYPTRLNCKYTGTRLLPVYQNRLHQLDCKATLAQGLPIDSEEIESVHRYIVQPHLKTTRLIVDSMLALRII